MSNSLKTQLLSLLPGLTVIGFTMYASPYSYAQQMAGIDSVLKNPSAQTQPVVVPPISFVDVNSGRFGKLEVSLEDGQFLDSSVDNLHLLAKGLDIEAGALKSLEISIQGGHVRDFIFDKLKMETAGDLKFNPGVLLNHRLLQFDQPAQANISVIISQRSLNSYLGSPRTLERLSVSANKKANALAGLAGLVGIKINQVGLSVDSASLKLSRHNQFKMEFAGKVGLGNLGLPLDGQIIGVLALQDGSLVIRDPHLSTGGQEIPKELANFLLKKVNLIPTLSQSSDDIRFDFTHLKILSNKEIQLNGVAYISRLRFGHAKS